MPAAIARVLVDSPLPQLDRLFDYRIPDGMEGVEPGVRVSVPLRTERRMIDALVVELADQQDYPGPLSDLDAIVSAVPVLRPEVWALARAVATRAAGSASDVLRLAIPKRQVRVETAWLDGRLAPAPLSVQPPERLTGYPAGALDTLLAGGGRAALTAVPGVARAGGGWVGRWAVTLAEAARAALATGGSALLVVPDYRDVEQVVAALAEQVPAEAVVRWDARQPNPDRYRALLRAADAPVIVVGTRSAVYAPAERLALLAVWDDGDPLQAEPLAPYVHARDAALMRHEQQGGALLLAGHVRSAEAERLVELGWLGELRPERPPRPRVIPTANLTSRDRLAEQARIPSSAWAEAREAIRHGPVLVQVARPGFAPGLACADCGEPARCRRCAGPLRLPSSGGVPACLWCGTPEAAFRCRVCDGTKLRPLGSGSTRTAAELGRAFPGVPVRVSDGEHPLTEVGAEPALVVATRGAEPIAAGGYRAVLLLDGERMLARESLRVSEDCLRWWTSAAALAADGAPTVLVGVGGSLATAMATWRFVDHTRSELADRRRLRLPPAVRSATLTGLRGALDDLLPKLPERVTVWGPTAVDDGDRAILLFDYADGPAVAAAVRAEVIRLSGVRRAPTAGPRRRRPVPLRPRFDDPSPFEE